MAKSKTGLFALGFFIFASLFVLIAFVSPYWLVTDGKLKDPKFVKIGKFTFYFLVKTGVCIDTRSNNDLNMFCLQDYGKCVSINSKKFITGMIQILLVAGGYSKRSITLYTTCCYLDSL